MKIPRKFELNESVPFFTYFSEFWSKYKDDFLHIDLNSIAFVKDEIQNTDQFNMYMQIKVAPKELMILIPNIKFILIVYKAFKYLMEEERDFYFYNCLFQIPQDYIIDPRLKKPDFLGFSPVIEEFKKAELNLTRREF